MTTALSDLRTAVDRRLGNLTERQNAQAEGDGSTNIFKLPDENIAAITTCTVNSVAQTESPDDSPAAGQYYLDYDSGWIQFGTTPADTYDIIWAYTYKRWSTDMVDEAINAAIDYIFGEFYGRAVDTSIATDASTYEFWAPNCEQVHEISHQYSGETRYDRLEDWRVQDYPDYIVTAHTSDYLALTTDTTLVLASANGVYVTAGDYIKDDASAEVVYVSAKSTDTLTVTRGQFGTTATTHASGATWRRWSTKKILFANPPDTGTLRLLLTKRAPWMSSATDTLEITCGLPQRAKEPIVCYACYQLLMQRANMRVVDDRSHNQLDENVVLPSDIMRQAQTMKFACDTQLQKTRMKPVRKRLVI